MKLFDTAAAATAAAAAAVSNDALAGSGTFRIVPWVETTIYLVRKVAAAGRSYCM